MDGSESRQWLYVAISRGRIANFALLHHAELPGWPTLPRERCRAPELDRAARLERRACRAPDRPATVTAGSPQPELDEVTVLAQVLARDGSEMSATETLERELARADHLGVLGGIWDDLVRREQKDRFEAALRDALPGDLAEDALGDAAVTWLWRSLREAETCGLDGGQVLREAIAARSMTGARDVARVLDSRVRRRLDGTRPAAPVPWADRVPADRSRRHPPVPA